MAARLLCLLLTLCILTGTQGQDTCHQVPLTPIYILNNPSLLPGPQCGSTFLGIPFWYPTSTEMLTYFLSPCDNYVVSDSVYIAGTLQSPVVGILPLIPQPVPDGKGVIAIGDYGFAPGGIHVNPTSKSFASTCLTQPLRKDSLYQLDFYAGFGAQGSQYIQVTGQYLGPQFSTNRETFGLFGMSDCSAVGHPVNFVGCVGRVGWIPLGEVTVSGNSGQWTKASILFTPPADISAIAIGPSCDTNFSSLPFTASNNGHNYYSNRYAFYLDSLQFYSAYAPPPIVNLVSGDSCSSTTVLEMQPATYYAGSSFQWYRNDTLLTGQQDSLITIPRSSPAADTFRCQVLNDSLCLVSSPFFVTWAPLPSATALGSTDTAVCQQPDSLILNALIDGSFQYVWQDGSTDPYFKVTHDGTYTVTISNACGSAQARKTVNFVRCDYDVYVPNAFTPNNDGNNDRFRVHFFDPPSRFSLQVFNRGGSEVYSTTNPTAGWDGSFNNIRQPAGGYIWYIRFTDNLGKAHSITGTLVLIR